MGSAAASVVPGEKPRPPLRVVLWAGAGALILIAALLALALSQALWLRWAAIVALAWWLPGALLVAHWRLAELDLPTAAVLALGLGLCWMILVALLLHWLPGPIAAWPLIAAYALGALLLLLTLFWRRPLPLKPVAASTWIWLIALVAIACLLRLPGLGYHELHGDEALVLNRAKWAILGVEDILARHAKGPGEIAVALPIYRALGTVNEATARLPFAVLGVGSVLATALVGRRLFSPAVGFWAGVLLATNGFALALSRIVQYQPAMLLLSALAVLCAWEFAVKPQGRWLLLTAILAGFGVLMHYEFALLAPALAALVWVGWRRAPDLRHTIVVSALAGLAVVILIGAAYLPSLLSPLFAGTQRYLGSRLGGLGAFNLPTFVELGTFYNSTYYFAGLVLLVLAGLVVGWRRARRRTLLLVLWFLPFFLLHLFVMESPGTHFYLFMPSWSLLAALPLAALTESRAIRPAIRWALVGLATLWLLVSCGYLYLAFFRQAPEYIVNYDRTRLPFYWAPFEENVPLIPRYAFPIQEGWKALGTLAQWGCVQGSYASNEGSQGVRFWYLPALRRVSTEEDPDWVFVASHVQAPSRQFNEQDLEGYQRAGEVRVRGEPRVEMWRRAGQAASLPAPYVAYDLEDYAPSFDRAVPPLAPWPDPPAQVHATSLGDGLVLESAGLERTELRPGDQLHALLVWRLEQALAQEYKVFLHLAGEDGRPVAQWDGFPCSSMGRTSRWPVGEDVRDHVLLRIPDDLAPGTYAVLAGMYDASNGERVGGQAVQVGTVTVLQLPADN